MLAFFSRRIVRWALMVMAVPVVVWVADKVAIRLEGDGSGSSTVTRALRMPGRWRRGEPLLAD